jgi:dolichol-phosphate mannosyltransferase
MINFSIIIPVYNEQDNILVLLDEINKNLSNFKNNYEIIVIDDCSTDKTNDLLHNFEFKNLKIIKNITNSGQSYSLRKGIENAMHDIIITIDGDMQNNPNDIPKMLSIYYQNKYMLVGGIRNARKDSILKIFSSFIANFIRKRILNDDCNDTGCSLKIFDKNIFLLFPFFDGIHRFLPALFKGFGYKTFFVNVDHRKRYKGVSKYGTMSRLVWGIRDIYKVLKIIKNKDKYV